MAPRTKKSKSSSTSGSENSLYDDKAIERYEHFSDKIITKVYGGESHIDEGGFHITEILRFQGLHKFVGISTDAYPTLLRYLYANARLKMEDDGSTDFDTLITKVNGTEFTITEEDIVQDFKLQVFEGAERVFYNDDLGTTKDWAFIRESISMDPTLTSRGFLTSKLTLECRILHKILTQCVLGKTSGTDQVSLMEQYFLSVMTSKSHRIDWPYYFFCKIRDGAAKLNASLPYAFAMSSLMIRKGVQVQGFPKCSYLPYRDLIGETTLKQMKCVLQNGKWVEKGKGVSSSGSKGKEPMEKQTPEHHQIPLPPMPKRARDPNLKEVYDLMYTIGSRQAQIYDEQENLRDYVQAHDLAHQTQIKLLKENQIAIKHLYQLQGYEYPTIPDFDLEAMNLDDPEDKESDEEAEESDESEA